MVTFCVRELIASPGLSVPRVPPEDVSQVTDGHYAMYFGGMWSLAAQCYKRPFPTDTGARQTCTKTTCLHLTVCDLRLNFVLRRIKGKGAHFGVRVQILAPIAAPQGFLTTYLTTRCKLKYNIKLQRPVCSRILTPRGRTITLLYF